MDTSNEFTESIKFKSEGLPEIEQQVESLFQDLDKARRGQEALAKALGDPIFTKAAREVEALRRANQALAESQREAYLASTLPTARRVVTGVPFANTALAAARERLAAERAAADSDRRRVAAEMQAKREARRAELQERFGGRLGGVLATGERMAGSRAAGLGLAGVGGAGAFVWSQARAGMENTAELERFNTELMLARRSLAGSFKPALDTATTAVTKTRRAFDGLSGTQQDMLMGGTFAALLAGGAFATSLANVVAKRALGAGLGTLAGEAVGSMGGRILGTAAGNVAGTAAGTAAGNLASGAAGGMAGRAAGLLPAAGAFAASGGIPLAGAGLAVGYGIYDALYGGYYPKFRESGMGKGTSLFSSFGATAYETSTAPFQSLGMPSLKSVLGIDKRDRLSEAGGGMRELGQGFDEMTAKRDTLAASDYTIAADGKGEGGTLKDVAAQVAIMVSAVGELVKVLTAGSGAREHRGTTTVR